MPGSACSVPHMTTTPDEPLGVLGAADVTSVVGGLGAGAGQLVAQLGESRFRAGTEHEPSALSGEQTSGVGTDAGAGAGDDVRGALATLPVA
jgi:hypothetical protein